MSQLVKAIYVQAKGNPYVVLRPFQLEHQQWRAKHHRKVQEARWYNQHGQYLGMGDLAHYDLANVAKNILPDELFVVVRASGVQDVPLCDQEEMSVEFLAQVAYYVIGLGCIWQNKEQYVAGETTAIEGFGEVELISPAEILGMLKTARIVNC